MARNFGNPFPKGSIQYKEFESDVEWLKKKYGSYSKARMDEFGNYIIYKTSGTQRLVIILLILIFIVLLSK